MTLGVLLLHVVIGATSGARLLSETPETVVQVYSDTSCGDRIGVDGITATSDQVTAAVGSECTPPHGECFSLSPTCLSALVAISPWWTYSNANSVVVWWSDLGGEPERGWCPAHCMAGFASLAVGLPLIIFLWLSGAFAPKTGPIPGILSPLPVKYVLFYKGLHKPKTPATTTDGTKV